MNVKLKVFIALVCLLSIFYCSKSPRKLPILGERQLSSQEIQGKTVIDTLYHTIADFSFLSQDSALVTPQTFKNKIYVADFFFTSCPTICPKMKTQLLRVYKKFEADSRVMILSHSIDPRHDSVAVLRTFAKNLGVNSAKWLFVTGEKEKIYDIGQTSYFVTAATDSNAPGGIMHSGHFVLIDTQRRIRGLYDGTLPAEVDKLMQDIEILLAEKP